MECVKETLCRLNLNHQDEVMPTRGSHIVAKKVSVTDRPFLIGKDELMGYLGVDSDRTLYSNYLDNGLHWDYRIGAKEYYMKESVNRWLAEHTERWIDVPKRKKTV